MVTTVLTPNAKQQFFDNSGRPLVGGKLFTYISGTTTKQPSYVNSGGVTQNSNPIILDYRGECNLWVPPNVAFKYVLAPSTDTDPPTNPIWTVDQIVSSQLITLYGGVDTGAANFYVLNFVANFTAYTDGIIIYWIPSNSNTGPSVINVNGLGNVPILNQDGSQLYFNELVANQVVGILYKGTGFVLISKLGTAAFSTHRITTVQSMPANTTTTCLFNQVNADQGGNFNGGTSVFTAPRYGVYQFNATITLVPGGTNCVLNFIYFSRNNSDTVGADRVDIGVGVTGTQYSNTGNSVYFAGSTLFVMNAGDTLRMKWNAGASGAGTNGMGLGSNFSGVQIG